MTAKAQRPVIYTAIFGPGNHLRDPQYTSSECDYVCFTDRREIKSNVFQIVLIKDEINTPRFTAKKIKLQPDIFIKTNVSLWIDSSVEITTPDIYAFIKEYQEKDFIVFETPDRNTVAEEVEYCILQKKDEPGKLKNQFNEYKKAGFPDNIHLIKATVILRKNTNKVREFNDFWWLQNQTYSLRDEISFPFAVWKKGWIKDLDYSIFPFDIRKNDTFFVHSTH